MDGHRERRHAEPGLGLDQRVAHKYHPKGATAYDWEFACTALPNEGITSRKASVYTKEADGSIRQELHMRQDGKTYRLDCTCSGTALSHVDERGDIHLKPEGGKLVVTTTQTDRKLDEPRIDAVGMGLISCVGNGKEQVLTFKVAPIDIKRT